MKPETLEDRARAAGEAVKVGATTQDAQDALNAFNAFNAFIGAETKRDRESRSIAELRAALVKTFITPLERMLKWLVGRKG